MNIKVAAFTVNEKSINTMLLHVKSYISILEIDAALIIYANWGPVFFWKKIICIALFRSKDSRADCCCSLENNSKGVAQKLILRHQQRSKIDPRHALEPSHLACRLSHT